MAAEEASRPRLLVIGDAVAHTGFARVIRGIFSQLVDRYTIFQLGVNCWGDPHDWPWPIYPADIERYSLGEHRIPELVRKLRPDLVFVLNDPEALARYLVPLRSFEALPVVLYGAYNAGPVDPEDLAALEGCTRFVVFTEFARREVEEGLARSREPIDLPPIEVLPLGVDTEVFHPLDPDRRRARRMARQRLFPDHRELHDAFIVLNANRNSPRKRIDVTMEGFARFAKGRSGVFLHLHMGVRDLGWDIQRFARRLGIGERLILTQAGESIPDLSDVELNALYNAADVGINTATSEGWGLISFEQAASGLAQMVPGHTSGEELWHGAAELLRPTLSLTDPTRGIAEHLIDPAAVASALHHTPSRLRMLEQAALKHARDPRYRWDNLSVAWDRIFQETLAAGRRS